MKIIGLNTLFCKMNTLTQHTQDLEPKLKEKGWHVIHHDYYLGITGYKKKPDHEGKKIPLEQHIVSINKCRLVDFYGETRENIWEVKTHWTTTRNIFTEFEPAWEMFLSEEQKHHPKDGLIKRVLIKDQ